MNVDLKESRKNLKSTFGLKSTNEPKQGEYEP